MDPLSQGIVGAVAAQQPSKKGQLLIVTIVGFLSGMAPDIDIFFRSDEDPLLYFEFHRQFTHSLIFIPFGGLICATIFYNLFLRKKNISFRQTYIFATLGYATHGLLDSSTSYGTQLFWPFTDERVAWNLISIIDPIFTIPLLILVFFAMIKNNKTYSYLSLLWITIYMTFGFIQKDRAEIIGKQIASSRGHMIEKIEAKPSFANSIVWKIIYTTKSSYHIDAVKLGFDTKIYEGTTIKKLSLAESYPWLNPLSQQAIDVERFRWFSNGYLAKSTTMPNQILDVRFSVLPNEGHGLWGIELNPNGDMKEHVKTISNRKRNLKTYQKLWRMIID
ncbi:MAG: metal-dependent hydrolase [Gammaproteobacteria bacterium]|nr:metal-dependent hydrolase [Gammaproteobacteria bacterium]|tara:strand:+ start:525 stop:1523 length:999 start_codon:yes stop_codon:yes gene_type:complete